MPNKLTLEEFTKKAFLVHGDLYDYSQFIYKDSKAKSIIICKIHGEFLQTPNNHLHGHGCLKCSGNVKLTFEEFAVKAGKAHGDKYGYSEYVNCQTKIGITCAEHGIFYQTPNNHLNGQGCIKCSYLQRAGNRRFTSDKFEEKARFIHGNLYDYSKVEYKGSEVKVAVICKKHGVFYQTPNNHLNGQTCYKCSLDRKSGLRRATLEEFIIKSRLVHGDKYDYSKFVYLRNRKTKSTIICPQHGEFRQTPRDHLDGKGCSSCSGLDPKWQRNVEEFVKSVYSGDTLYNDRTTIKYLNSKRFLELDLYLPQIKIAFECQGEYFHDEVHFPGVTQRDLEKQQLCLEAGISLITIWENEWNNPNSRSIIENQINSVILSKLLV